MQFTTKSKEHIDACRFCWMCHHVCPIGIATGLERNSVRARAMSLSLVARDAIDYSDDIVDNVYECSLCGGCMTDCVTGWDPVMFTKEARLGAALDGKLPAYIMNMVANVLEKGNIYGETNFDKIPEINGGDTLLFLGENTRARGCAKNAIELLEKAGVEFSVLKDEPNSGYSLDFMIGEANETKAVMEKCSEVLNGYKTVICYDPADARVMKREYKEWGITQNCTVVTFTEFIASLIKDGKLSPEKSEYLFTPQDSPLLARDLEETQPLRDILSACGDISEMLLNKSYTMLAGNFIMAEYLPDVMKKTAECRWTNAINVNAKAVITTSTAEYNALLSVKPENIELLKLEEAVLKCL